MIAPLGIIIGILIIGGLGVLAFEIGRVVIARDMLRAATDAGALSGALVLSGSGLEDPAASHEKARQAAEDMCRVNDIFGVGLAQPHVGAGPLKGEETVVKCRWFNPLTNEEVPESSEDGRVIEVSATFGYQPLFGRMLGLGPNVVYPMTASSQGGVPIVDVVVCFDVSGSIDDQTKVTFVRRVWNPAANGGAGRIEYETAQSSGGGGSGELYNILKPEALGSGVNAYYPQHLDLSSADGQASSKLVFNADLRAGDKSKPGNAPEGKVSGPVRADNFTDLVVNLDSNDSFMSFVSKNGYAFPTIGAVVEAARGNLDSELAFEKSGAKTALKGLVEPRLGYKKEYKKLAKAGIEPLTSAKRALVQFFDLMHKNTLAHFGLIAFSWGKNGIGTEPNSSVSQPRLFGYSELWTDSVQCPLPMIGLDANSAVDNYSLVRSKVLETVPFGGTWISPALEQAVSELKQHGRRHAKKVIVLFTDGQPTGPQTPDYGRLKAREAAQAAHDAGIPIYTIGLSQNPDVQPGQQDILTDEPGSQGIAAISGNGARFFQVGRREELRAAFQEVARDLTQLVR